MNFSGLKKISKSFDGIRALDNFSFKWESQHIIGLIGPNGAGKTTLFNIITGFIPADSGEFYLKGQDILSLEPHKIVFKGISRTFQDLRLLRQITVMENVLLWRLNQYGEQPWQAWLRGKKFGEQQILALGMALIQRPKLLLMDEPSLGLAPAAVKETFSLVKQLNQKYNMSILIVEQKVKEVLKIAHRSYVLRLGKVALEGNATEMLEKGEYKKIFLS